MCWISSKEWYSGVRLGSFWQREVMNSLSLYCEPLSDLVDDDLS